MEKKVRPATPHPSKPSSQNVGQQRVSDEYKSACSSFEPQMFRGGKCKTCFFPKEAHNQENVLVGISTGQILELNTDNSSREAEDIILKRSTVFDKVTERAASIPINVYTNEESEEWPDTPPETEQTPNIKTETEPEATTIPEQLEILPIEPKLPHLPTSAQNTAKATASPAKERHRKKGDPRQALKRGKTKRSYTNDEKLVAFPKEREKEKKKKKRRSKGKNKLIDDLHQHTRSASTPSDPSKEKIDQAMNAWIGEHPQFSKVIEGEKKKPLSNLISRIGTMTTELAKSEPKVVKDKKKTCLRESYDRSDTIPKVLSYPQRRASIRKDSEHTRFNQEILAYLRVSVLDFDCVMAAGSVLQTDGIGLRFNMNETSLAPLVVPLKKGNYPPSQWIFALTRDDVMKKPNLEVIVQDYAANIVLGNVIISLSSIPFVHPNMTYGITRNCNWTPYWNIQGKIRLGFKMMKAKRTRSLTGSWDVRTCGGNLTNSSWIQSPQYYFKLVQESCCAITLCSSIGEHHEIGFYVFLVSDLLGDDQRLDNNQLDMIERNVNIFRKALRVDLEIKLDPGCYIVLPCTQRARIEGDYQLTIATTDGTLVIRFNELKLPELLDEPEQEDSDPSGSDDNFMDGLDMNSIALKLNQQQEPEDLDDLDWDKDLDDFDDLEALSCSKTPSNTLVGKKDDPFGDGFDDDFDIPKPASLKEDFEDFDGFDDFELPVSQTNKNNISGKDKPKSPITVDNDNFTLSAKKERKNTNLHDDDFEDGDGFDDLDLPVLQKNKNNANDKEELDFEDGFDDGFDDFDLPGVKQTQTLVGDDDDDDFGDGFDDDFTLPVKKEQLNKLQDDADDFGDGFDDFVLPRKNQPAGDDDAFGNSFVDAFDGDFDIKQTKVDEEGKLNEETNFVFDIIKRGQVDELNEFLDKESLCLEYYNDVGDTPLIVALKHGSIPVIRTLLSKNADVNKPNKISQISPIVFALRQTVPDIVKLLTNNKCNASTKDHHGNSGYACAIKSGHTGHIHHLSSLAPPCIRTISVQRHWELSSLYVEATDIDEASVRPAESLEILEIVCPYGGSTCVFQVILYSSFVFSVNIILCSSHEDSPWKVFLAGFIDIVLELIKQEDISPNYSAISDVSGVNGFLLTPVEMKKWDRGVDLKDLKDFGLLCNLLEYAGGTQHHTVLDYVNFVEHTVVDFRKLKSKTVHKFYTLNGILSHWKTRAIQVLKPIGTARLAFSLSSFRNLKKDVKSDIYFIVGINSQQTKSTPRRYKETDIGLCDIWFIDTNCDELYIVLYSKDKNVNSKPLAQVRIPLKEIKSSKRSKDWISLNGVADVHFEYCYAECLHATSSSMRDVLEEIQ